MGVPNLLYRNTSLEHARAFVEEGEILFRPLTFFRNIEDATRADAMEAKFSKSAAGLHLSVDLVDDGNFVPFVTLDSGVISFEVNNADQIHVACLSLRPQPKFGDSTIEIFKPAEFLERLSVALDSANALLRYGSVQYYDESAKLSGPPGRHLWLMKRKSYESEAEFRLSFIVHDGAEMYRRAFKNEPSVEGCLVAPFVKVRIGALTNISRLIHC